MQKLTQDYKYKKKDWKKIIIFSLPQVKMKLKNSDNFCFFN